MSPFRIFDRHPHGDLSAYADGQISWKRGQRVERHLGSCAACRAELTELRSLSAALSDLPEVSTPRSFALTPEQVAEAEPATPAQRAVPSFMAMRVAGAGVAAVLALVVLIDTGGISTDSSDTGDDGGVAIPAYEAAGDRNSDAGAGSGDGQELEPLGAPTPGALPDSVASGQGEDDSGDYSAAPEDGNEFGVGGASQGDPGAPEATPLSGQADADDQEDTGVTVTVDKVAPGDDSALPETGSGLGDDGGISTLLVFEIVLGFVAVAAIGGSFLLPRLNRERN
jgi:hypothetical protein